MTYLGAGSYPFGTWFAGGNGIDATVDEPGPASGVAFINQDGDYETNGTGDVVKTTPTAQRALLLLRSELNSIAHSPQLGLDVPRAIDASFEYRLRRSIETALLPMTSDGTIAIDQIDIERTLSFRASVAVSYTVLASGEQETVKV
jgi:hypothetical protein